MLYTKVCPLCGKEFTTKDKRTKFCSMNCAALGRHSSFSEDKICAYCGKYYVAKARHQKYCSELCYSRSRTAYDSSRYRERKPTDCTCIYNVAIDCLDQNCENCGWNPKVAQARLKQYKEKSHEG